jgi:hypothetical protein
MAGQRRGEREGRDEKKKKKREKKVRGGGYRVGVGGEKKRSVDELVDG